MPQALAGVLIKVVGSKLIATVAAYAITAAATSFLSGILTGGQRARSDTTETDLKQPTPPRTYGMGRRRFYGAVMLFDTAQNGTTGDVWALLHCPAGAIEEVEYAYLNDDRVTMAGNVIQAGADGRYGGSKVRAGWNIGLPTETPFSEIVGLFPTVWSNDHRGDQIFSCYLTKAPTKAEDFLKIYPQGDQVTLSLVAKTYRCFDPRNPAHDPADPATWAWTENAALHLLWYFMVIRGYDYAARIAPVVDMWIAAADICDEPVPLRGGGTEPRYRGCVTWDATKLPGDIQSELLACFDGWTAQDANGCQRVYAGKLYEPTYTLGPDQIISSSRQYHVEDEDRINELVVQYVSEAHDWNTVECQPWRDEADISSRGRINSDGFAPQTPSHSQNRRLAKRRMARQAAGRRGTILTNVDGREVLEHRYIYLDDVEAGATFYSGWAEVVDGERNNDMGGASFNWIAVDPNMDAWNPATEEGDPAPVGARVALSALAAPVITDADVSLDDSGASARARVMVEDIGREDTTWYLRWRVTTDAAWNEQSYSDAQEGAGVLLVSALLPVNDSIDLQAAYSIGDGRVSPWSATETVSTSTENLAPAPVTDVSATGGAGEITANWRNPGSGNYSYTRVYAGTSASFGSASALTPDDAAGTLAYRSRAFSGIGAGTYHVWVEAFSGSDIGAGPVKATGTVTVT